MSAYKFGSYTFPQGFNIASMDRSAELPQAKTARAHGAVSGTRRLKAAGVSIQGKFMLGGPGVAASKVTSVDDELDLLRSLMELGDGPTALASRGKGTLWLRSDRWFRNASVGNLTDSAKDGAEFRVRPVQLDFYLPDPLQYSGTAYAPTTYSDVSWVAGFTDGSTRVVNYSDGAIANGTAPTKPVIAITLAASAALNMTLTNQATGDQLTLAGTPSPAATVITVDCLKNTVLDAGLNDQSALFGSSVYPTLEPQLSGLTNTWLINIGAGHAATINSITFTWYKRWW